MPELSPGDALLGGLDPAFLNPNRDVTELAMPPDLQALRDLGSLRTADAPRPAGGGQGGPALVAVDHDPFVGGASSGPVVPAAPAFARAGSAGPAGGPGDTGDIASDAAFAAQLQAFRKGEIDFDPKLAESAVPAAAVGPAAAAPALAPAPLPAAGVSESMMEGVPSLPSLPKGVYARINPVGMQQDIARLSAGGLTDMASQLQKDMDRVAGGEMLYSDGVWRAYPGGPKDPQVIARAKLAEAVVTQRAAAQIAPQKFGPGESIYYPGGSPGGSIGGSMGGQSGGAPSGGASPQSGVTMQPGPGGGVVIGGGQATPLTERVADNFAKLGDTATASQHEINNLRMLRGKLNEIGAGGPLGESFGYLSSLAQQVGVPQKTLDAIGLPKAGTTEEAQKLTAQLMGEILKATVPQRITNVDIGVLGKPSVPGVNMPITASNWLIDNVLVPRAQRDIDRYQGLVRSDAAWRDIPSHIRAIADWDLNHPPGQGAYAPKAPEPGSKAAGPPGAGDQRPAPIPEGMPAGSTYLGTRQGGKIRVWKAPDGTQYHEGG